MPMKYGFRRNLDIKGYPQNAAKNFSFTRILIYTAFSLILTIALFITTLQSNYQGTALLFTGIAFVLIVGFTILNIKALIIKVKESK